MPDFPIELPGGYTVERDESGELIIPVSLQNEEDFREIMTRESMLSFPSAAVGTVLAGPAGTVAGHLAGTSAGIIRHSRIHPDDDITEPELPGVVEDE
jgi:hypothetical protein